jgi:hypothetical protein|tara:strand:+ start:1237 stop:1638 length:402 start_codon:yes stop_codon:yes gene_type:complete
MENTNPFVELRKQIRLSGTQFRRDGYDKNSIFHQGQPNDLCYAYDIPKVEAALDSYVENLPIEYQEELGTTTLQEQVLEMAISIAKSHVSMEARDFARTVRAYLAYEEPAETTKAPPNLLSLHRYVKGEEDNV